MWLWGIGPHTLTSSHLSISQQMPRGSRVPRPGPTISSIPQVRGHWPGRGGGGNDSVQWGLPRGWLLFHARLAANTLTTISFLFPTGPVLLSPLLICGLSVHIKNIVSNEAHSVQRQEGSTSGKRSRELFLLEASTTQPTSPDHGRECH